MGRIFISRITDEPDLSQFDCDNGSIQNSIKEAYLATLLKQGYAYDVRLGGKVIGHYMIMIAPFNYIDEENYHTSYNVNKYAALHLHYLAVDKKYQNTRNKFGTNILKYIVKDAKRISEELPIRFLSIDALRERYQWYLERGFHPYNPRDIDNNSDTIKMFIDFIDRSALDHYCDSCE